MSISPCPYVARYGFGWFQFIAVFKMFQFGTAVLGAAHSRPIAYSILVVSPVMFSPCNVKKTSSVDMERLEVICLPRMDFAAERRFNCLPLKYVAPMHTMIDSGLRVRKEYQQVQLLDRTRYNNHSTPYCGYLFS
ncbi:hypothetical protein BYT27DRAFT_6629832 [Phlegmacium glaucopus]|nr:hypothetical protein BYT27DRAFT_6629832 [Phlegmacium glaucopus]